MAPTVFAKDPEELDTPDGSIDPYAVIKVDISKELGEKTPRLCQGQRLGIFVNFNTETSV